MQFVSQPYTSDVDHTGALSEAIVTLPQAVAPQGTIELEIAYEGVVLLDATRLTRIDTRSVEQVVVPRITRPPAARAGGGS